MEARINRVTRTNLAAAESRLRGRETQRRSLVEDYSLRHGTQGRRAERKEGAAEQRPYKGAGMGGKGHGFAVPLRGEVRESAGEAAGKNYTR